MLMSTKTVRASLDGQHKMPVNFIKINKAELLSVENPHYADLVRDNAHLSEVKIADSDTKNQLPVHVIFGSSEYARIKTETKPQVGDEGKPIAELTKMGWFIMSPGTEFDRNTMLYSQTSQSDYEELCRMDELGLADASDSLVKAEQKQLVGVPWQNSGTISHILATRCEIHREASTTGTQRNSARGSGSNHGCCSRTVLDSTVAKSS